MKELLITIFRPHFFSFVFELNIRFTLATTVLYFLKIKSRLTSVSEKFIGIIKGGFSFLRVKRNKENAT